MKPDATASGSSTEPASNSIQEPHHRNATFSKVFDGRKQPIRNLWVRNDRYYAQLTVEDAASGEKQTRRVPLADSDGKPVQSVAEARAALERLRTQRRENSLPILRRTPKFSEFVDHYLLHIKSGANTDTDRMKRESTIAKEEYLLAFWKEHLGETRIDQIKQTHINAFIRKRKDAGRGNRTVNIDVIVFRNVMKHAIDEGHIRSLPFQTKWLKVPETQRPLFTPADLEKLCAAAFGTKLNSRGEAVPVTKNAHQFVDYIRLLAFSGARCNEALRLRWSHVDFENGHLTIGAEGDSKDATPRNVDLNSTLKAHLQEMAGRRAPDSQWLFPSPQRGNNDSRAKSFRESLKLVREAAGLPGIAFHDFRHMFASYCVMAGIDFKTVAAWLGHDDGGILVAKVYGHLANEHRKRMAERVKFAPTILDAATSLP